MVRISLGGNGVVHVLLVTLKKLTISFMYASCERKTEPSRKYWKRMPRVYWICSLSQMLKRSCKALRVSFLCLVFGPVIKRLST